MLCMVPKLPHLASLSLSYKAFVISATKSGSRKLASESERTKTDKNNRSAKDNFDLDLDSDLSNDINGIVSALHLIRDKAQKDGQKKNEETISRVGFEVKSIIEGLGSKFEKDRSVQYESSLQSETTKFQELHENFCEEKATSLQAPKGTPPFKIVIVD
ncbi:hypothetical protein DEO72_LG9g1769 [Vigna unguiculata]|uniref:Uncharacterized protein n=1 Tax=Vigna unguiculata TaxID=3917 RepID=A0A4D6N3T1_VIGUN|nr:hypothetical protein DEO72_LG9g1769 [Vigna unguiculata]